MAVVLKGKMAVRDVGGKMSRSRGRQSSQSAPVHLPQHLQLAITTYRRQADRFGDLDPAIRRFLDCIGEKETNGSVMAKLVNFDRGQIGLKAGTILSREWNGIIHRAIAIDDGFLWDGTKYDSLSAIAFAITGTRWNGPRFFGLRYSAGDGENMP